MRFVIRRHKYYCNSRKSIPPLSIKILSCVILLIAACFSHQASDRWSKSTFTVEQDWSPKSRGNPHMLKNPKSIPSAIAMTIRTPVYLLVLPLMTVCLTDLADLGLQPFSWRCMLVPPNLCVSSPTHQVAKRYVRCGPSSVSKIEDHRQRDHDHGEAR